MNRDEIRAILGLQQPLRNKIANMIGRGVVTRVDDLKKLQLLQLGVLANQTVEGGGAGAEHFQPYGFSSVPLEGAEMVVLFPNGDQSHPLVIATSDRRHRPTDGDAGDVMLYHHSGSIVKLVNNGDIEITAAGKTIFHGATTTGPTAEGVVVGSGIDPFTGQTYTSLTSASVNVFAKKL